MITDCRPYFSADAVSTVSFVVCVLVMDELFFEEQQLAPVLVIEAFLAVFVVLTAFVVFVVVVVVASVAFVIEALVDFVEQHPAALSVDAFLAPPHGAADATVKVMPAIKRPAAIVRSFM